MRGREIAKFRNLPFSIYRKMDNDMKIELLAPAGSYQAMVAAINAGADAVYIGGYKFGARAYANNLNTEEMLRAIDYVHIHDKKLYLTVNTLLKSKEVEDELYQYLEPFYKQGLDAIIVQDMGVLKFVSEKFPDLPIHASTQMTITGIASVNLLMEAGVKRVVMPRELSLEEIIDIHQQTNMELEGFVHGALCYSYSGQCLFSSFLGGRSGNRGRCAGPCRLPYKVSDCSKQLNSKEEQYLLSPKDICTIEILPEIIAAGITSLKIEGRMKKPEYTAGVVKVYRKYLDILDKGQKYVVDKRDYQELLELYNRDGFSQGYYKCQNGPLMMAMKNEKVDLKGRTIFNQRNEQLFAKLKREFVDKEKKVPIKGTVTVRLNQPLEFTISCRGIKVVTHEDAVQEASKQPLSQERISEQLSKTGNTPFVFDKLDVCVDDNIFVPIQVLNEVRRRAICELRKELTKNFMRFDVSDSANEERELKKIERGTKNVLLSAQASTKEQLETLYKAAEISSIYADVSIFIDGDFEEDVMKYINEMKGLNKKAYLSLPYVVRDNMDLTLFGYCKRFINKGLAGFLVHNIEGFAKLRELGLARYVILDYQIPTLNEQAQQFWYEEEILYDTVSPELNYHEMKARDNSKSEITIYGYAPMMITAQCLQKNIKSCTKEFKVLELTDRYQKKFKVKCDCNFCYNIIYNSIALGLSQERDAVCSLGFASLRLVFTTEDELETSRVTDLFVGIYHANEKPTGQELSTKGHFKRGIK